MFVVGNIDGRSRMGRRYRDIYAEIISDQGGDALLSEGQKQLARRASALSVLCERSEAQMVASDGDITDAVEYTALVNCLQRVLGRIGLRRVARAEPGIREVLASEGANA